MRRVATRNSLSIFTLLGLVLFVRPDSADAFNMEGATIKTELRLPDADGNLTKLNPNDEDVKDHFNLANCVCGTAVQFGLKLSIENGPAQFSVSKPVDFWSGSGCDAAPADIQVRNDNCVKIDTVADIDSLRLTGREIAIPVASLTAPNSPVCSFVVDTGEIYALIDDAPVGIDSPSDTEPGDFSTVLREIVYDMEPPPAPESLRATGAENAIQIDWELPTVRGDDIRYFQVLCAREDGSSSEADGFGSISPQYLTSQMACESDADGVHPTLPASATAAFGVEIDAGLGAPDAGVIGPDAGQIDPNLESNLPDLYNLKETTICGEAASTDNGVRVDGLENGVEYHIVLVAVDEYRNATAIDLGTAKPQPAEDAWEHYKEAGGQADGGYCFVATATFGNYDHPFVRILRDFRDDTLAHSAWGRGFIDWYYDTSPRLAAFIAAHPVARALSFVLLAPLVAFAAVWEYTGALGKLALLLAFAIVMVRRRRRARLGGSEQGGPVTRPRRRAIVAVASVLLLLGLSANAEAQPYWDELNEPIDGEPERPNWNFEIKAGPYYPNVDDEFSGTGPFEEVFGAKWKLMTIFSLDRFFAFPAGQLGVTGSIGFSTRSAAAYQIDENGNIILNAEGEMKRSTGDTTSFDLLPTSVGVVYRLTLLDDQFRIPVVPYGKASLAYYIWRFSAPSGDVSESRTSACPDAGEQDSSCDGNLGQGASLGYQATLGLAFRAERIDPDAERSLRTEMGIEHAGFFVEVQLAAVNGFGASDKLAVGDSTWFGGINFEF